MLYYSVNNFNQFQKYIFLYGNKMYKVYECEYKPELEK